MSQALSKLLRLEWGQNTFPIESCKPRHRWARSETGARQGYLEKYDITGEVTGDSAAAVAAAREALKAAMGHDNQIMRVVALDNHLIHFLDPAVIFQQGGSGPYVADLDFDDTAPRNCRFKISIAAQLNFPGGINLPPEPEAEQEIIRVDRDVNRRERVRRSGRIQGTGAYAAAVARIPLEQAGVQVTFGAQRNEGDTDVRYEIGLIPLAGSLRANTTDGEVVIQTQEDALTRVRTVSGYFVGPGAEAAIQAEREGASNQRQPVRMSVSASQIQTGRRDFRAEFVEALRADNIVGWRESVRAGYRGFEVEIARYPGTRPLFVVDDLPPRRVENAGEIRRRGEFYDPPPAPLFPPAWMDGPGDVTFDMDAQTGDFVTRFRYSGSALGEYSYGSNGPLKLPVGVR